MKKNETTALAKIFAFSYHPLLALLAAIVIMAIDSSLKNFVSPDNFLTVDYFSGLAIYLVVGLMILRKARPKVISFFAGLTITVMGFSVFFSLLTALVAKHTVINPAPSDGNLIWQSILTLHYPLLYGSGILLIFMCLLLFNTLRNPRVAQSPWVEKKRLDLYWVITFMIAALYLLDAANRLGNLAKRYRSFLQILGVGVLCLILGRTVILQFELTAKESQAVVWWFAGFAAYLFLGRKLIKSGRKVVIFSLLAASLTISFFLTLFFILSFFQIYGSVSQVILSWPVFSTLIVLGLLTAFGWAIYYNNLPGKSVGQEIREWLKAGKDVVNEKTIIMIILLIGVFGILTGIALIIFQSCLAGELAKLSAQLKQTGNISLWIGVITAFLSALTLASAIFHEQCLAKLTPEEREKYKKEELEAFIHINEKQLGMNDPFNPIL